MPSSHNPTEPMSNMSMVESYAQRRQLFKNIWKTALEINADNIMNKPKIIKTLRMDEMDRSPVGKTKKERLRNLRHVCNKLLDFCDKQEAEDAFYQKVLQGTPAPKPTYRRLIPKSLLLHLQVTAAPVNKPTDTSAPKTKKMKVRIRKNGHAKKAQSMFTANANATVARYTSLDNEIKKPQDTYYRPKTLSVSRNLSPIAMRMNKPTVLRTTLMKKPLKSALKIDPSPRPTIASELRAAAKDVPAEPSASHRKVLKKKVVKKKKPSKSSNSSNLKPL